jgi:uncharacterized protein YqjF (DUF2071 family)
MSDHPLRRGLANDGLWPVRLPWVMSQRWEHLLYLHYRVAADELRALVPEPLEVDEFDGSGWVSVIPLRMMHIHLRDVFPIPGTANFPEINVRTYVVHQGVPGVYFLSIDASSRFSVLVARASFDLPYHEATMSFTETNGEYRSVSDRAGAGWVRFEAVYRPTGETIPDPPGSQTRFLAERYCMYSVRRSGRLLRGDISHLPWSVESVEATIGQNDLLVANGVTALDPTPVMAYSVGSDSHCWPMRSASVAQRVWPRT